MSRTEKIALEPARKTFITTPLITPTTSSATATTAIALATHRGTKRRTLFTTQRPIPTQEPTDRDQPGEESTASTAITSTS